MINYSSNINVVVNKTLDKIKELQNNPDPLLRTVALTVMPELRHRVHVDGKDSEGNQIGTYSPGYMKVRTGNYRKPPKPGVTRPNYHRTADTKVVASLTRQMENDLNVVATENGYGIGYLNPFNFQKSQWVEETYKKPILSKLTDGEEKLASDTANQFTADLLK